VLVPERLAGRTLSELELPGRFDVRTIGLMRGTEQFDGQFANRTLKCDDRLLLLGKRADLRRFADSI